MKGHKREECVGPGEDGPTSDEAANLLVELMV